MISVYDADVRYGALLLLDEDKRKEFFGYMSVYAEEFFTLSMVLFEHAAGERALGDEALFEREFRILDDLFLFVAAPLYHAQNENLALRYSNAIRHAVMEKIRNSADMCESEVVDVALRSNYNWGIALKNMLAGIKNTSASSHYAIVSVIMLLFELFDYTALCAEGRDIIFH